MNYRHVVFILIAFILSVRITYASVVINEVAWMGTGVSANDEWIELYNPDNVAVSLLGWTLNAIDGSPMINLSGSIAANGYYLAERTDDMTVPGVIAGVIYSGSMANTGETLVLKDGLGQQIDIVSMTSGWIAGNSDTKETMQKNGSTWITNSPTPGAQNETSSTGNSETDPEQPNTPTTTTVTKQKTEKEEWIDIASKIDPDTNYSVRMIIPDTIVAQAPAVFSSEVMKFGIIKDLTGKFEWSMGDGKSFVFNQSKEFTYTYQHPGTYVIMINYYSNVFKSKPDSIHKIAINVLSPSITVVGNPISSDITLTNNSTGDIDIKDWKLEVGDKNFKFSASTVLSKDASIIIPQTVHGLSNIYRNNITIITPSGYTVKSTLSSNASNHSNYTVENVGLTMQPKEENLFEKSERASAVSLKNSDKIDVPWWIIGFILLTILLATGFYILTNKLTTIETASKPTL